MDGLLDIFTVCFFGHRQVDDFDLAESGVKKIIEDLYQKYEYVDFLVCREGDFDYIVSSAIKQAQKEFFDARCSHICILPYEKLEYRENIDAYEAYFDEVSICGKSALAHPKAAYSVRNQYMICRDDLCVFYVSEEYGGAWKTMRYAQRINKPLINICDPQWQEENL